MEEQTKRGTPREEPSRRGAPSKEDFLDKLPISINWAEAIVELFNKGNWTGGENPSRRAKENFEDTLVYSD